MATHSRRKTPQPYYFTRRDGQPITFAAITTSGLIRRPKNRALGLDGDHGANKFVAEVHDRMPVILEAKDFQQRESG